VTSLTEQPPDGFRWVFRDIVVFQNGNEYLNIAGFELQDADGVVIWGIRGSQARNQHVYHWTGHQVVENTFPAFMLVICQAATSLRITGYELSVT